MRDEEGECRMDGCDVLNFNEGILTLTGYSTGRVTSLCLNQRGALL